MQVYLLVPAHNEAGTIASVVHGAVDQGLRIIVINDHCTDATAEIARAAGADVWQHTGGRGKAAALRWAWQRLLPDPHWTHLLLMDGDGQHDARHIPDLLAWAADFDLVVGSRTPFRAPMPRLRRAVNRLMSALLSLQTGWNVRDSQSGFRLVSRRLIGSGRWTSASFELESEMILEAHRLGCTFTAVPVGCRYGGRPSHIRPWLDTWRWICWWGRSALAS